MSGSQCHSPNIQADSAQYSVSLNELWEFRHQTGHALRNDAVMHTDLLIKLTNLKW